MDSRWSLESFEEIYNRFLESGLPPKAFCCNECISSDRFYTWRKKLLTKNGDFVPVRLNAKGQLQFPGVNTSGLASSGSGHSQGSCEIVYPNGVTIRLNGPVSPEMLRTLILLK
jgi:hypothetical protein